MKLFEQFYHNNIYENQKAVFDYVTCGKTDSERKSRYVSIISVAKMALLPQYSRRYETQNEQTITVYWSCGADIEYIDLLYNTVFAHMTAKQKADAIDKYVENDLLVYRTHDDHGACDVISDDRSMHLLAEKLMRSSCVRKSLKMYNAPIKILLLSCESVREKKSDVYVTRSNENVDHVTVVFYGWR